MPTSEQVSIAISILNLATANTSVVPQTLLTAAQDILNKFLQLA